MREMIEEGIHRELAKLKQPHSDLLLKSCWDGLDAAGFGFTFKGGGHTFVVHLDTPRDLDRFGANLVAGSWDIIGEYEDRRIIGYWKSTKQPVLIGIGISVVTIRVNSDHPDSPVYSFLADLRRYVDPCARLEKG